MPKFNPQKKIEQLFRKRRVVTMSDLCEVIGSSSRMTVFRRLRQIEYVSSYTHAGRYIRDRIRTAFFLCCQHDNLC